MRDSFLDELIGHWTLSGQMGDAALLQRVSAHWVLAESFVEMRFAQTDYDPTSDTPLYEAIYLIGFEENTGLYVFHLFDTFGVTSDYKFAKGTREGNRIEFLFPYSSGPFYNTLEWADDTWTWLLEYEEAGARKTFATKRMTRWAA